MSAALARRPPRALRRIRGLTIIQPWATLIVDGPKRVENRGWRPSGFDVGDYIAIHAGAKLDLECWFGAFGVATEGKLFGTLPVLDRVLATPRDPTEGKRLARARERAALLAACPYSAILGVARLARIDTFLQADTWPWYCGPFGWVLDEVRGFEPVPCSGALGLWEIPAAVLPTVRQRWKAAGGAMVTA